MREEKLGYVITNETLIGDKKSNYGLTNEGIICGSEVNTDKKVFVNAQLVDIWSNIFGDDDRYIKNYFKLVFKWENLLLFHIEDKIISTLYIVPYELTYNNSSYKVMYLYALATLPNYRDQGIMSKLVEEAHKIARKRDYIMSFLTPANERLFGYYSKFGYNNILYNKYTVAYYKNQNSKEYLLQAQNISFNNICENKWKTVSERKKEAIINTIWNIYLKDNSLKKNELFINYSQFYVYIYGLLDGKNEVVFVENRQFAIYLLDNNKLKIIYTNGNNNNIKKIIYKINEKYNFTEIEIGGEYNSNEIQINGEENFINFLKITKKKSIYRAIRQDICNKIDFTNISFNGILE